MEVRKINSIIKNYESLDKIDRRYVLSRLMETDDRLSAQEADEKAEVVQ